MKTKSNYVLLTALAITAFVSMFKSQLSATIYYFPDLANITAVGGFDQNNYDSTPMGGFTGGSNGVTWYFDAADCSGGGWGGDYPDMWYNTGGIFYGGDGVYICYDGFPGTWSNNWPSLAAGSGTVTGNITLEDNYNE
jgi:hypothetical protein